MANVEHLDVYKRARDLFPIVYRMVRSWNYLDQREIGSQMIRAANSIHANIAEGYNKTPKEFKRYLSNAIGSCDELCSHIHDAHAVNLLSEDDMRSLIDGYEVVGKQLTRLKQQWK